MKRPDISELRIDRTSMPVQQQRSGGRLPWWIIGAVVCMLAVGGWWLTRPLAVRTAPVGYTTMSQQLAALTASGHVVAQVRAAVGSKATGRLIELRVREGSVVRRGDLIARLDPSDADATLNNSRAGVRQATARAEKAEQERLAAVDEFDRTKALQAQGFVSNQAATISMNRVRTADAGIAAAAADVDMARALVGSGEVSRAETRIHAPFDGVVLVRHANVGEIISPLSSAAGAQSAVVTLADMGSLEIEADVSESELSKVQVGQPVEIALDALPHDRFRGTVSAIVPTVDRARATVKTKIRFESLDARVLPEMSARVTFLSHAISNLDQRPLLTVPVAAVRNGPAGAEVFRVQTLPSGTQAQRVAVVLGRRFGSVVEVTGATPLSAPDRLVLDPPAQLRDGARVLARGD